MLLVLILALMGVVCGAFGHTFAAMLLFTIPVIVLVINGTVMVLESFEARQRRRSYLASQEARRRRHAERLKADYEASRARNEGKA